VSGVYIWGGVSHPADSADDTLHQYRWIARLNPGDDGAERVVDSVAISSIPPITRLLPTVAEAQAGKQLSPNEAEMVMLSNGTQTAEHKYDYSLDSNQHQIHGLYHSKTGLGVWTLSPYYDYHNGAFDAQDLTSYGPTVYTGLNLAHIQMLNGGHYGEGDELVQGAWSKLYGPWLWYFNRGNSSVSALEDAWAQFHKEERKWPYAFVSDPDYHARGTLSGTVVVTDTPDPRAPVPTAVGATVFLTNPVAEHGPYTSQCNGYTYWNTTDAAGRFFFYVVRAGTYELHVSVPGVLSEKSGTLVKVTAGSDTQAGTVTFTVPRNGTTVWEIGYADRTAKEFKHGDAYRFWGLYDLFPTEFPNSVHYYINSTWRQNPSQWRSQWNYAQVPANGTVTNWSIYFDVASPVTGPTHPAFVRIAFAGVSGCPLVLTLNGAVSVTMAVTGNDGAMARDGIHGIYQVRTAMLDSSSLKERDNVLVLTARCTTRFSGLMYDALRFELAGWTPSAGQEDARVVQE
jgi:rhamnogalacturonan endolyase